MPNNFDTLIEINLNLLSKNNEKSLMHSEFVDENNKTLYEGEKLAEIMKQEGLINIHGERCDLTRIGIQIAKSGGWLEHLEKSEKTRTENERIQDEKLKLEMKLAKSNIEANKLNKINQKRNSALTIINIVIGAINLFLFAYQLFR